MHRSLRELFVDRSQQTDAFRKMLDAQTLRQIMLIEARSGMGKTWLLHIFIHEAKRRNLPLVYIDFADRQPYDSLMLIRRCRDGLGLEHFNQLTDVINYATTTHVTVSAAGHTPVGAVNVSIGSENVLTSSTINVSEVGNTVVKDNFFLINTDDSTIRQIVEDRITITFFACLARLCSKTKVVLLLDSYERNSLKSDQWVPRAADRWVQNHLLARVHNAGFANLIVVLAGQRVPEFGSEWNEVLGRKSVEPFVSRDVKEYLSVRRGLSMLTDTEIERLYQAVAGHPQMLGLIGDNLEHANQSLVQDEEW
jgi:hypothetical protein